MLTFCSKCYREKIDVPEIGRTGETVWYIMCCSSCAHDWTLEEDLLLKRSCVGLKTLASILSLRVFDTAYSCLCVFDYCSPRGCYRDEIQIEEKCLYLLDELEEFFAEVESRWGAGCLKEVVRSFGEKMVVPHKELERLVTEAQRLPVVWEKAVGLQNYLRALADKIPFSQN